MFTVSMLPAEDGDCLFVEVEGCKLLIDGGRATTGTGPLAKFIAGIATTGAEPKIDIAILTHIDSDHISGLLTLLNGAAPPKVREIWFNGFAHHRQAAGATRGGSVRSAGPVTAKNSTLGVSQAMEFVRLVELSGANWNSKFGGDAISVTSSGPLPRVPLTESASIVMLGPPKRKLAALLPAWKKGLQLTEAEPILSRKPAVVPTIASVPRLAAQPNEHDKTAANGASLAFVIECGGKRALFAADAHPKDLTAGLDRYGGPGRISFDLIKVSHHGSARNNPATLIDKLQSGRWLISTSGSVNSHPDPATLARIVLSPGVGKQIFCNYCSDYNKEWANASLAEHFGYEMIFGNGLDPLTIQL